jgi:hypothetical protein
MATGNKHSLGAGCIPEDLQSLSHLIAGSNPGHATDDPIIRPWRSECCEDADPGPWRFGITSTWWPRRRPGRRGARFGVRQHALEALLHGSEIGGAASVGIGRSPCCDPDLLMPFKANASRRHHILKQKRKVTNWAACDASLRQAVKLAPYRAMDGRSGRRRLLARLFQHRDRRNLSQPETIQNLGENKISSCARSRTSRFSALRPIVRLD